MCAGRVYKYDLSMPLAGMYQLVDAVRKRLHDHGPSVTVTGYGHVGDGNLHLNISDGERRPGDVRSYVCLRCNSPNEAIACSVQELAAAVSCAQADRWSCSALTVYL